jgi:cation transport protein ChaC
MSISAPPAPDTLRYLSESERQLSMMNALSHWQGDTDLWVYGYGSLIWNPEFAHAEQRLSMLRGHHRSLCLWSRVNRGTPELPGLVFGLDRGGSCRGMAFRIEAKTVPTAFEALWRREMSTGAYHPRWLKCDTDKGPVSALTFVIDRSNSGYVRGLEHNHTLEIVRRAHGRYGPCVDYVVQTHEALCQAGIRDGRLAQLAEKLSTGLSA